MMMSRPQRLLHISSQTALPRYVASLSRFSSAPNAASIKPSPISHFKPVVLPTKLLPIPLCNTPVLDSNSVLKIALQDLKRKQKDIDNLHWLLERMKIGRMPTNTVSLPESTSQATQQRTFQVMNRNARKAKRANHGKRPCSRDRRRWKTKKWANTSRKG
ncbi:hypothetical protein ACHAW6_005218 [Cyclotella cf. meneghiniana]